MTVEYTEFLPYVSPYAPNLAEPTALAHIRNACIEFCRESLLLQTDIDPIDITTGQNTYFIDSPIGTEITQVQSLYYKGLRLERKSQYELERAYTRDWQSLAGTPKVYTQFNPNEVVLVLNPQEDAVAGLTGRICYIPMRNSTKVDKIVFERFAEVIADGALSRILAIPNEPFTDPNTAVIRRASFKAGIANAQAYVTGGLNHAPMRVRYNRIW